MTRAAFLPLCALGMIAGCAEDAVTLPDDWNTLHHRAIAIDIFTRVPGDAGLVRPLQGMQGAPFARSEDDADLTLSYWDRPGGSEEPDGTHVDIVRVGGPDDDCALALDAIYGGGSHVPSSYDFTRLEDHLASVDAVRGGGALLVLDMARSACGDTLSDAIAQPETWADVAADVARHVTGDTQWNPAAQAYGIAGVQLFRVASVDAAGAYTLVAEAARRIRAVAPDLTIASPELALGSADVDDFLDLVVATGVPLDVLSVRASGDLAKVIGDLRALVADIAARGLTLDVAVTDLIVAEVERFATTPPTVSTLALAQIGASEMALRIALQALPVRWLFSGSGPGTGSVSSRYFDATGKATAAFVMRAPMRQIDGEQRVTATTDAGDDLHVLATIDGRTLSVLIAQPASATGVASVTYTLTVPGFTLPRYPSADFRLSVIDQSNVGVQSFFFADLGALAVDSDTGDVHITRTLPVPGVHFIEIDQPLP